MFDLSKILFQKIEEKTQEKETLLEMTKTLSSQLRKLKKNIRKNIEDQQMIFTNSQEVTAKYQSHSGKIKNMNIEIEKCKKKVVDLGEIVAKKAEENENLKANMQKERARIAELKEIVNKAKIQISTIRAECNEYKKSITISEKQRSLLLQKKNKIVC